jgi:hypothetical protein
VPAEGSSFVDVEGRLPRDPTSQKEILRRQQKALPPGDAPHRKDDSSGWSGVLSMRGVVVGEGILRPTEGVVLAMLCIARMTPYGEKAKAHHAATAAP